jgi:hypothetical protein
MIYEVLSGRVPFSLHHSCTIAVRVSRVNALNDPKERKGNCSQTVFGRFWNDAGRPNQTTARESEMFSDFGGSFIVLEGLYCGEAPIEDRLINVRGTTCGKRLGFTSLER